MTGHPKLQPQQVFTPARLPLEASNVYATRATPEARLSRYTSRGQIPVVIGEYGVGKTSLVRRFFDDESLSEGEFSIYIPSASKLTIGKVFEYVLEAFDYKVKRSQTAAIHREGGGGLDIVFVRASGAAGSSTETVEELVVTTPTDMRVLELLSHKKVTIVIDEMHTASDEFRKDLVAMLKSVKNLDRPFPRVVLVGTTLDAERLVAPDPGIDRYVKEILVEPLTDKEATYIIEEGFDRLGLAVADDLRRTIVRTAAGAPTIVHSLCLDMAETALAELRQGVNRDDYENAVQQYLSDHGRRLAAAYIKAVETFGPKQYRRRILHSIAQTAGDYATLEDIRSGVSAELGGSVPSSALSGPLRSLKSDECGQILQDVERYQGGDRIYNLTAFTDPMMKSFIRFMQVVEEEGLAVDLD